MQRDPAAVLGCLLGGAVGDALGAPVEFMDWPAIRKEFGPRGIIDFVPTYGHLGAITDDTQMMLFTAEGLLRANVRSEARGICHPPSVIHHSLLRWLLTQGMRTCAKPNEYGNVIEVGTDGWLFQERRLWASRAPGRTCLNALGESTHFGHLAENNSKGCGGVMRVAPCAFFTSAFSTAAESSHMTHGHPTGYLAAGLFADILQRVWLTQIPLADAVLESLQENEHREGMEETKRIISTVLESSRRGVIPTPESIEALGGGWIAEEALAIGLWCALTAKSFEEGVIRAVNHSGDSDSTGLIAGHFLGLIHGVNAIPNRWLEYLELRDVIEQVAYDITYVPYAFDGEGGSQESTVIWDRYPGW
ncbi:MAG: ADP-ribosylglycohydrolase family protein [Pseudomonas sp.]|nr:ADP-ribosylglycohydrolase family protein [Pseudomonas sp.]MDP2243509.1 ADP-ribosylglycohydrolase family protein [Pseudomonas sp.]